MKNAATVFSRVLKRGIVLILATLFMQGGAWAMTEEVTVMTWNLYLGAEIQSLATAETEAEFLAGAQAALFKVAANNYPERAAAKAKEIAEKNPHLVGLQEVYNFTLNEHHAAPPFRNYLTDLLYALSEEGASYVPVAIVNNLEIVINIPGYGDVGVIDRDVILARSDVAPTVTVVNIDCSCSDDICDRRSADGYNYGVFAFVEDVPSVGDIEFKRGFVAVDALIGALPVRFINTHLEVRDVDPIIQAAQAFELVDLLSQDGCLSTESGPIVVVGDINSPPTDLGVGLPIDPPYMQLEGLEGYLDTWTLRPGNPPGFTCCQEEMLLNPEPTLSERVDVIFVSESPINMVKANVVGNDEAGKTIPSGLWPSDHAGVVTRGEFSAP